MKTWCLSAHPQGIQDVGDFFSSVEHKRRIFTEFLKKNIHRQNQIKHCDSWRYIEVLRHETISLCKKLNSIYIIFLPLIHHNVQLSWVRSQHPVRDASMCSGIEDACAKAI